MKRYKVSFLWLISIIFISNYTYSDINELNNFEPSKYYKVDTDGDGIIDIYDSEPNVWNVTDRDLRFFQEITYRTSDEIRKIFSNDESYIKYFNKEKLRDGADVRELIKHWTFVEQITDSNGFQASIFKNGNQAVLAFAGTNDAKDAFNDLSVAFSIAPNQAWNAEKIINEKMKGYSKYYITGHSLGGYLTMYAGATSAFNDSRFIHGAVFNSPGLNLTFRQDIWTNSDENIYSDYIDSSDKRNIKTLKKIQAYGIHGDAVSGIKQIPTTKWNNQVTTSLKNHSSSNFVATKNDANFREWFSTGYRLDNPYLTLDTDGDGILDVDELKIGTDYTKFDSDGDGFGDKLELAYSTDPMDKNSKPLLSTFYKAVRYGDLLVDKKSDIDISKIESKLTFVVKSEFEKHKKQIPELYGENGKYIFENLPNNWENVKDYKFLVHYKVQLPDSSITEPSIIYIWIKENKANENKKENELYKINIPSKIGVKDKLNIDDTEKKLIEEKILENNQDIPKRLTITIDNKGNVLIQFEDKSEFRINSDEIIYQKLMSESFELNLFEKIGVENLKSLTENEKQEIITEIRKYNNVDKVKEIKVSITGEVSLVFLDDSILKISSTKVVKQTLEKLEKELVKAEQKLNEIRQVKLQKNTISPNDKVNIDKKIDEYNAFRKNVLEKAKVIDENTNGFNVLKERINKLEILDKVIINDYNSNNILDEEEINKAFSLVNLANKKLNEYERKIAENKLITKEIKNQIDEIVKEYNKLKNDINEYLKTLNNIDTKNLKTEILKLKDISTVEISDEVNEEKIYESNLKYANDMVNKVNEKYNEVISLKNHFEETKIVSVNDKLRFDRLYNEYNELKRVTINFISSLKNSEKLTEIKSKIKETREVISVVVNDRNDNKIDDKEELNKANEMIYKLNELEKELNEILNGLEIISPGKEKSINEKIEIYSSQKIELYNYLVNLNLSESVDLIEKYKLLKDYTKVISNDLDSNNIIDESEILEVNKKIQKAIDMLNKIEEYKNENLKVATFQEENDMSIYEMVSKYLEYRDDAINSLNKLSDLISGKNDLLLKMDNLPTERELNSLVVDKNDLLSAIEKAKNLKSTNNYIKADSSIKNDFDLILNEAEKVYSDDKSSQDEVNEAKSKLENIVKLLNGYLKDSTKYLSLLHYNDTSILNFMENDGILFNAYLKKSVTNYIQDVIKDELKLNDVLGGVQLGYNHKINDNLSLGVFTEYSNTTSHNISLGFDIKNKYVGFFTRYRLNMLPNDNIYANNIDLYLKLGRYFDIVENHIKIQPSIAIYASYMAKTKLPNDVYVDHNISGSIDAMVNLKYGNDTFNILIEPKVRYIYDNPTLVDINGNKLKYNNSYYDYSVRLGLEKRITDLLLGTDFTLSGNKKSNNYRLNLYLNYTFR